MSTTDSPTVLHEFVGAGMAALETGDLPAALQAFTRVIEAFPERPEGHNNLGALYAALGQHDRAETCFDRVLELLPGNANVLYNRGVSRVRLEKFDAAHDDFAQVVAAQPDDPEAHNNLGVAAFMRGAFDAARAHLGRALELRPDYENALLNLCDVDQAAGDTPAAIGRCEAYLRDRPDAREIRRRHFRLLTRDCHEALDRAGRVAEGLLAEDEDDTETRRCWGRILEARDLLAAAAEA